MLDHSIIERAHERAQRRLRAMVIAKAYGDAQAAETRLYVQSERLVDALLIEAAWEQTKAELDALILDDRETDEDVAAFYTESELRFAYGDR